MVYVEAIDIGDMSGEHEVPCDDEGEEVVRQFQALQFHTPQVGSTISSVS